MSVTVTNVSRSSSIRTSSSAMISCKVVLTRALREYFGVLLRVLLRFPAMALSSLIDLAEGV